MKIIKEKSELVGAILNSAATTVYFYNDACAPCVSLRPKIEEMVTQNFEKMNLVFVNSAEFPELSSAYGVFASPTIIVFFEGKENFRVSKYISVGELSDKIERYYNLLFS